MCEAEANPASLTTEQRRQLAEWLAGFDRSWHEDRLGEFVRTLPPADSPLRRPALVELVKLDLGRQWRSGRRVRLEDYLTRFPELGTAASVPPELIRAEFQARKGAGDTAELGDFAGRFPHLAPALKQMLRGDIGSSAARDSRATPAPEGFRRKQVLDLPEEFGRYRIQKKLGQGGMGAVYLAFDPKLQRQVALKVPHFDPQAGREVRDRFVREARAAAAFEHPNICPVFDVDEVDGVPYLTMPYIEGKTLADALHGDRRLSQSAVASVARKVAMALDEAHRRGFVHRDLKPANVLINQRKEPVVMDFGLAKQLGTAGQITTTGAVVGTPAYMSPEQIENKKVGPASDQYSLGVLLYELLTGELPFTGPVAAVLAQVLHSEPEPPGKLRPDLHPALEAICLRALAKDPARRFGSMKELADALGQFLDEYKKGASSRGVGDSQPLPTLEAPPPCLRRRLLVLGAAAALALVLCGVVLLFRTPEGTIRVKVDADNVQVAIDGTTVRIDGGPIPLKAGGHTLAVKIGGTAVAVGQTLAMNAVDKKLSVRLGDAELRDNTFTVVSGKVTVLTVSLLPAPDVPPVEGPAAAREPTPAQPAGLVASYFAENDPEGWTTRVGLLVGNENAAGPGQVIPGPLRPDNYLLKAGGKDGVGNWFFGAPKTFLGDQADKFGKLLKFKLLTTSASGGEDFVPMLASMSNGKGLVLIVGGRPPVAGTNAAVNGPLTGYSIRLDSSGGWRRVTGAKQSVPATDEDIRQVLGGLAGLRIRGDFADGKGVTFLDDVELGATAPDAAPPAPPPPTGMVASYFAENDNEGWYTRNTDGTRRATSAIKVKQDLRDAGNYFLTARDMQNGKIWYWQAPAKFLGDQSDKFGRYLRFKVLVKPSAKVSESGKPVPMLAKLSAGKITLVVGGHKPGPAGGIGWRSYSIRLDASAGWKRLIGKKQVVPATDEDIRQVLAGLTGLEIRQWANGKDVGSLDDVELGAPEPHPGAEPPPPPVTPVVSRFAEGDTEGWYTRNNDGTAGATDPVRVLPHPDEPGNWFIGAKDRQNGKIWVWHAPPKFLGDQSDKFGLGLKFKLGTTNGGGSLFEPIAILEGDGIILARFVFRWEIPNKGWSELNFRLDGSGQWRKVVDPKNKKTVPATDDDIRRVLANLTSLRIRGEFSDRQDGGGLDDVELGAAVEEATPEPESAQLQLQFQAAPPGLTVRLDGEELEPRDRESLLTLSAGEYSLTVEAPQFARLQFPVTLTAGARTTLVIQAADGRFGIAGGKGPIDQPGNE